MLIGNRNFNTDSHCYVMGILNVTPDSFSDGGKWNDKDKALKHVEDMIADGMDILDIGGESTRPGYTRITAAEEISRTAPIIEAVKANFDIPVSIDTYKADVALAGIAAGADLINDIWGLKADAAMAGVIAASGVACCLMHNRSLEKTEDEGILAARKISDNGIDYMLKGLQESLVLAENAGIKKDRIILDPGVGFGKTYEQNLEAIARLEELNKFGYPLLLGTSRKSVVGLTLNLPADQRVEGTLVTTVFGVIKGAAFVRVHDVKENVRAIRMAEAILNAK